MEWEESLIKIDWKTVSNERSKSFLQIVNNNGRAAILEDLSFNSINISIRDNPVNINSDFRVVRLWSHKWYFWDLNLILF